ncbi:hypothetical protein DC522_29610 [Microvirga sp. KLBC 81]|nr:hypothetical protein DC522_29610 [Microvirga sp. KLBC 81]
MSAERAFLAQNDFSNASSERMITERDLKILWISRTLTNIDFQYGEEILNLDRSDLEIEQKNYIKAQLLLKYRERRAPYQELLESLRGQQLH